MSATFKTNAVQASFRMDGRPHADAELVHGARLSVEIKIDRLTITVGDYETLLSFVDLWAQVSEDAGKLPLLETGLLSFGGSMGISQLRVSADLHGEHEGAAAYVEASDEAVAHLRIQFGGLTFLVEDFLAWTTVNQTLGRAVTIFAEGLADQR